MFFSLFNDKTDFKGKQAPILTNTDESGRSLIEMLGTIAIITMLTVGGMTGAGYAMQAWRANTAADDIEQAVLGVQDLYSWQKDYKPSEDPYFKNEDGTPKAYSTFEDLTQQAQFVRDEIKRLKNL